MNHSNQTELTGLDRIRHDTALVDNKFLRRVVRLAKCRANGCDNTVIDPQFDNQLCQSCEDELAAWSAPIERQQNEDQTR